MAGLFTRAFWEDAVERAAKTAAQTGVLVLTGGAVEKLTDGAVNVLTLDWATFVGATAGGALLSLLFSVASAGVGNEGTASLSRAVRPVQQLNTSEHDEGGHPSDDG